MHILLINSDIYEPFSYQMSGIFQLQLSNILIDNNHRVGMLSAGVLPFFYKGTLKAGMNVSVENNLHVVRNFFKPILPGRIILEFSENLILPKYIQAFKTYIENNGLPDLIHCQNSLFAGKAALSLRKKGFNIPIIITEHSSAYSRGLISAKNLKSTQFVIDKCDLFTTVSVSQKNFFKNLNIEVLNNQVDTFFENAELIPINELTDGMNFDFITVGLLDDNKNQIIILKAIENLINKYDKIRLHIVGDGPNFEKLVSFVNEKNLTNNIVFHGRLNRENLLALMQKCVCLIVSSNVETFGVTALEALFLGRPCIATKCGGVEDFLNDSNSILINRNNSSELALAIEHIYLNYHRYNSLTIREDISKEFGTRAFYSRLSYFYDLTLKNFKRH